MYVTYEQMKSLTGDMTLYQGLRCAEQRWQAFYSNKLVFWPTRETTESLWLLRLYLLCC